MDAKVTYWVEMSDYDIETAEAMQTTARYLYVAFMCHQCIEKILKAYWSSVSEEPPVKIYSLTREYCEWLITETKQLQSWIKSRL